MGAHDDGPTAAPIGDAAAPAVTSGMVGHGFYNRHSAPQWAAIAALLPWLDAAVETLPLDGLPLTVGLADFGCSEGRNSITVMQRLVAALRARTARPIQTIHSDLPTNDFAALLRGLRSGGRSVFADPETYSAVVGGSMYAPLLPPRSVHLATTFNAIGFLSRRPLDRLPGYILPNGPSARHGRGGVDDADRRAFATQALSDVERFLAARAGELVPGGKLLVQVFGRGDVLRTCDGIYDALNDALLEVVAAGLIDRDRYETFYQPVYFRSLDELVAPVASRDAPLAHLFRLERAETYEVSVPFVEAFRRTADPAAFAKEYTDFFRAFTEPVLRLAFADHPQLDRLVGEVFERAERLIRDDPDRYELHYVAVAMLLTRRDAAAAAGEFQLAGTG